MTQAAERAEGDYLSFDISQVGPISADLGAGYDTVEIKGATGQVRLTFTSAEVGNASATDAGTLANQDGGLAVRAQLEGGDTGLTGFVSRFDDEGITFLAAPGLTFDVRDLVSGTARGDQFSLVFLGRSGRDVISYADFAGNGYYNGGMGDDRITAGAGNDFLVGGAGNDRLIGGAGADSFIGGSGDDSIAGGRGNDTVTVNFATDGGDVVNLGAGADTVNATAPAGGSVMLSFAFADVGNGLALGSDGQMSVMAQLRDVTTGAATGAVSRFDDEGTTFVSNGTFTFLVVNEAEGNEFGGAFGTVALGSARNDEYNFEGTLGDIYAAGGIGDDRIRTDIGNDVLIGGAGDDFLAGGDGNDLIVGGAGSDTILTGVGDDIVNQNVSAPGADRINTNLGMDTINITADEGVTQVRLTFTSSEVGDESSADSNTMANQDGDLAVRIQAEGADDSLTGDVSRADDEMVTFVSRTEGLTFDIRDLVSGTARGDMFEVAVLGSALADTVDGSGDDRAHYINLGMGDDTITGSSANDFLVGGMGDDVLDGGAGNDMMIGGGDADTFVMSAGMGRDIVLDFVSGTDTIDLSAFGVAEEDTTVTTADGVTTILGDADGDGTDDVQFTFEVIDGSTVIRGDVGIDGSIEARLVLRDVTEIALTDFAF